MNGIMRTFLPKPVSQEKNSIKSTLGILWFLLIFFSFTLPARAGHSLPTSVNPQNLVQPDNFSRLPQCNEARNRLGEFRRVVEEWNSDIPESIRLSRNLRERFRSQACELAQAYNMGEYRTLSNAYAMNPNAINGRNLENANVQMCLLNESCRLNGLAAQRLMQEDPGIPEFIRRARRYQACELARRTLAVRASCQGPSLYYFLDYARRSQTITIPAPKGDSGSIGEASCTAMVNDDESAIIGKAENSIYDDAFDRFDSDPNRAYPSTALLPPSEIGYSNCGTMR